MILSDNLTTTLGQTVTITCEVDNTVAGAVDNQLNNNEASISFKIFA